MGLVFSPNTNNSILPKVKLLIEDHDKSFVSKLLPGAFNSDQLGKMFDAEQIELDTGRDKMEKGKASALLIIPSGFGSKLLNGEKTEFILVKNPGETFAPKIAEETINIFAEGADRLLRIADKPRTSIRSQISSGIGPTDADISHVSILINQLISRVQDYLFPPLITIVRSSVSEKDEGKQGGINIFGYILAGVMVMSLFFVMDSMAKDIFQEKENLTLYRLQTTPLSSTHYIISKLLSIGLLALLSHFLVWIFGSLLFQIHFSLLQLIAFIPFSFVLLFAMTGIIVFLYSLFKTRSQASAVIPMVIIFFSMLGGSMIPFQSLPLIMQKIAVISPVYWGVNGIQKIVLTNEFGLSILRHYLVLFSIGVITVFLSVTLLGRRLRS